MLAKDAVKSKKGKDKDKDDETEVDLGPNTCTGTLRIGKTNFRDVDLQWWRSQIGLVQQEPFLFNDTIFNNVAYGLCGTQWQDSSKEEKITMVEEACREAHASEFIERLPQGYDTLVGESGIKLSGGQRQRIAIARSIIKKPPVLILDEATSAIDVRTERTVQEALDRVSQNRTTIVIAHRLSTIKRADKIMVMRQGKLVEEGTHEELLKKDDGVYHGLVNAQELMIEAEEEEDELEEAALHKTKTVETEKSHTEHARDEEIASTGDEGPLKKGFMRVWGRVAYEQRHHWVLYSLAIFGVLAAGGKSCSPFLMLLC